ncbi:MAG: LysR family transcriptional regulator [Bacillota bacterium]|nr:LysR family transcriptional regulator [Bacillota bacterium]
MNYNYLKYFQVLAQTEHYTQAANILGISQPSLSHAIDEIEKEINIILFEKQGRNIKLTKYGAIFYDYVNSGLNDIRIGIDKMKKLSNKYSGEIDFGYIYTLGAYYIPNVIQSFLKKNPEIGFNLRQGTSHAIVDALESEEIDVGMCSLVHNRPNINFIPVLKEEMIVVVSNKHPLASKKEIDLTEISPEENWLIYSKNSGLRSYLDKIFSTYDINPHIRCEVMEDNALLGLVDINYGIAIIPNIPNVSLHNVAKLKIKNELPDRNIYLAVKKNRTMLPSVQLLLQHILYNVFDQSSIQK